MSRVLGVDYGERRIGIALSDPTRTIASPLTTLSRRTGKRPPWSELERLVRENEVTDIVLGLPLGLNGEDNDWTAQVRAFGTALGTRVGCPVHLVDERLSSVQAERAVRGIGLRRSQREDKARVDAAAAAIILKTFLSSQRKEPNDRSS